MSTRQRSAPGQGTEGATRDQEGARSASILQPTIDIPALLRAWSAQRFAAAVRLQPLEDGRRDPEDRRLPDPAPTCSRGFACRAQSLEVLKAARVCPCVEAQTAVQAVAS
jgi:hypothetical protein